MHPIEPRHLESNALHLAARFPVVGIVGPRQVGKTTLAKRIASQLPKPVRYFDLEYPEDRAAMQEPTRLLERMEHETVIIDEVQLAPGLFPVLRALIDRNRIPGRFILLGSASPALIQHSSETLAGRIAYLELQPFAFSELPATTDWQDHWLRGGFPDSVFAEDDQDSFDWRQNFVRTYLERDLPLLGLQADPVLLRKLWTMLAHLNAQMLNMDSLSASLAINSATLKRYLNFFESAYLVARLQPYTTNVGKRLVKTPKIFLRDTGILHYLLNIREYPNLLGNPALGASWEAYVLQQVMFHLPSGFDLFFYRTHEGAEADIVITKGGFPEILLEVKFSTSPTVSKGFFNCQMDLKTNKNYIVAPINNPFPGKNGIEVIGLKEIPGIFL